MPVLKIDDPRAEQALAELKRKLQQTPKGQSLIAAVQQREQKCARRERAAVAEPLRATVVTMADDPTQRAQLAYDQGADGRDEREESEWFRALPRKEQERLRGQWADERCRFTDGWARFRVRMVRAMSGGALVMGILGVLQSLLLGGFELVPAMAFAGACAGGFAELFRGDRFVYALCGGLAWVCVMGPVVLRQPFALPGLTMAAYGLGAIGMEGEMRRSGGFKDR
jgi:hypothetical protein